MTLATDARWIIYSFDAKAWVADDDAGEKGFTRDRRDARQFPSQEAAAAFAAEIDAEIVPW